MAPSDTQLVEHALGLLSRRESSRIEGELRASRTTRQQFGALCESLGQVGLGVTPVQPRAQLRERIQHSLEPESRFDGFLERLVEMFDLGVERMREIVSEIDRAPNGLWEEGVVPANRLLHFEGGPRVREADCGLVYIEPGAVFPKHTHGGAEWNLALSGIGEELESGEIWHPGDCFYRDADDWHSWRAAGDEPFVFAVVLFGGFALAED